jgi:diaminopimelate epimerase
MALPFIKMHGLGNDFVILDARKHRFTLTEAQVRRICDRHFGIGCDQLVVMDHSKDHNARLSVTFYNADGSTSAACGNGTRCVAALEKEAGAPDQFNIEVDGVLLAADTSKSAITIDMGEAHLDWRKIPLSKEVDTLNVPVNPLLPTGVSVNLGNPHIVFFVPDAEKADVEHLGPKIENDALFPERANVEFASIIGKDTIRMRVWERGAGITLACGSGACATLVAAARRGLTGRKANIVADGGTLIVTWLENNHVLLEGPTAHSFSGEIADALLKA